VNVSSYNLTGVMDGDIDLFVDEPATREMSDKLSGGSEE